MAATVQKKAFPNHMAFGTSTASEEPLSYHENWDTD